jgi:hypothetical protein
MRIELLHAIPNQKYGRGGTTMKEKEKEKVEQSRPEIKTDKASYQPPVVESHNPLEIMSAWEDKSSELEY